jgi:hypothetical protein
MTPGDLIEEDTAATHVSSDSANTEAFEASRHATEAAK